MKKITVLIACLILPLALVACGEKAPDKDTDESIMEFMEPYLTTAQQIDISSEEGILANLGITLDKVTSGVLYLGMPNQNSTYFAMITPSETADRAQLAEKLTSILDGWVSTGEQGYIEGNLEYKVVDDGQRIIAFMHEDATKFEEISARFSQSK